jgi:hypothetical protein
MQADGIPDAFRAHFTRHNRQVLSFTIFTFVSAILLWAVAYFVIYWIVLLAVTTAEGIDAHVPRAFLLIFTISALLLCALAWAVHKIHPDYFPRDRKPAFEILMDFVLAPPRVTLAIWGNFSAWLSLSEDELEECWELLKLVARQRKVSIQSLPLEIPDPLLRSRVVFALQLAGLVELRRNEEGAWLAIQGEKARRLVRNTVKIEPRQEP